MVRAAQSRSMNPLPLPSRIRRGMVAAGCAAAALALSPALASADSIVYVKDGNIWLASGSGGNQYQVTTDGTAQHPYRSPSQADDGTIAIASSSSRPTASAAPTSVRTNAVTPEMMATPPNVNCGWVGR